MIRRLGILVLLTLLSVACGRHASQPAAPSTTSAAVVTTSAAPTPNSAGSAIPDPCTLLSDAEVTELTGRAITQIDKDGADTNATTRYCQWQQSSGQLAVFITRMSGADFATAQAGTPSTPGIGDAAYTRDGHLYVLVGTSQVDVYARGGDDQQSETDANKVAAALVPKVRTFS